MKTANEICDLIDYELVLSDRSDEQLQLDLGDVEQWAALLRTTIRDEGRNVAAELVVEAHRHQISPDQGVLA